MSELVQRTGQRDYWKAEAEKARGELFRERTSVMLYDRPGRSCFPTPIVLEHVSVTTNGSTGTTIRGACP